MRSVEYYSVLQAKMRTSCDVACEDRGQAVFEHVVYAHCFCTLTLCSSGRNVWRRLAV